MARGRFRVVPCGMTGVFAVEAESAHAFPRHSHEQFGIGLIDRGAQRSLSGRGVVEAGAGDVITVNPGEVHDGAPLGCAGRAWRMLYLDPALVVEAGDLDTGGPDGTGPAREFRHPVLRDATLARAFGALYDAVTTSEREAGPVATSLRRDEALAVLVAGLLRDGPLAKLPTVPAALRAARELIDDDPAAPTTLADLARVSGLGRFQVVRGFASAFGLTPHAYLVQRRVDLARGLIAGGAALADAAAASGFADQSHMTRTFGRRFGLAPGALAAAANE